MNYEQIMGLIGAGVAIGAVIPDGYRAIVRRVSLQRFNSKLGKSAFAQAVNRDTQAIDKPAVKTNTELKAVGSSVYSLSTVAFIKASSLPSALRSRFLQVARTLEETEKLNNLNVEEEHDLGIVKENLLTALNLFESFTLRQRDSEQVAEQMNNQLDILESVLERVQNTYEENQMRELKIGTEFLTNKFATKSLDTGVSL